MRYLVMRDPYFADPAKAIETANPKTPYRSPSIERLTEKVQAVQPDGSAIIQVTLEPEPGFEDATHPIPPTSQTVVVTPLGEVVSPPALSSDAGFLRAFFRLPPAPAQPGASWKGAAFRETASVPTALTLAAMRRGD